MSAKQRHQQEHWRNAERYCCAVCNVWMAGDRQSILVHENGKKHKEALEKSLQQKRDAKQDQEKAHKLLQSSLAEVERAAARAHALDPTFAATASATSFVPHDETTVPAALSAAISSASKKGAPSEKKAWESRKKKREKTNADEDGNDDELTLKKKKKKLAPDQGHYTHGDTTYLEGPSYADILEEDMPIQIWTGSNFANLAEKRLAQNDFQWKYGLVVGVRNSSKDPSGLLVDVAYLMQPTDENETLEKSVSPSRIRIILGADDIIPDTLEEARLAVMNEEVTEVRQESVKMDENTGLSSWGTVAIRKTTVRSELKEERERARAKRREDILKAEQELKDAEGRRMEEAKVENADDSALGAYDVWASGKGGYKGVDIHKEATLDVQDTAKILSQGKGPVGFKKTFKTPKKRQNRRTTSADD